MSIKAHKIKLHPTEKQIDFFNKSFGVARFSFNWGIDKWIEMQNNGLDPSAYTLVKLQNSIKKEQMPFFLEVAKTAPQHPLHHVEKAFKKMITLGYNKPKYKKKGIKDSFVAVENNSQFKQENFKIWVPRLGWVRCCENLRFDGRINYVVIKRTANMYFAIVNVDNFCGFLDETDYVKSQNVVGLDLGIKAMITVSDGTVYENPKALKNNIKSLKRLQRGLSRKKPGSNNFRRNKNKLSKKYYKISCIRNSAIHKVTTEIVNKYDGICIETLEPQKMAQNKKFSFELSDVSFGEIIRQLKYKYKWNNKEIIKADKWFASSKLCSNCGNLKSTLTIKNRTYCCDKCSLSLDRDLNAAINLAKYGSTLKHKGSKACGESVAERQSTSVKQEINYFNN